MSTTSLVVMEPGSDWPGQIGDAMSVVTQSDRESLVRATEEKLETLTRHKQRVRVAVLACSGFGGSAVAASRAQLGRTLLGRVIKDGHGKLVVCASGSAGYALREELLALVGSLIEEARGTSATVSLRFQDVGATPARRTMRAA